MKLKNREIDELLQMLTDVTRYYYEQAELHETYLQAGKFRDSYILADTWLKRLKDLKVESE